MKLRLTSRALIAAAIGATICIPVAAQAADPGNAAGSDVALEHRADRSIAAFEGRNIDLSQDWGDAKACLIDEAGDASCYRSEAALDAAMKAKGMPVAADESRPNGIRGLLSANAATCGVSARFYSGFWYSGNVLVIGYKYYWTNMSWFGFDNITSSYKMGLCYGTLRSGSYGSGSTYYGGPTGPYGQDAYMGSWDNVLSSVYLY